MRERLATLLTVLAFVACDEEPLTPAARFERSVAPVLAQRCAAAVCHGVGPDAEAAGEDIDWSRLFFRVDAAGRLADPAAARRAALAVVDPQDPEASTLLRKAVPMARGGLPHAGGVNVAGPEDPAYRAIRDWIASEPEGAETPAPLDALEQRFADTVQPALVSAMCFNASCHGLEAPVPYRLDPGIEGRFPVAATRHNYAVSRTMLAIGGDPTQARLLRKALPLHAGGVLHKGGNRGFLAHLDDPRAQAIAAWACAEHAVRAGAPCGPGDGSFAVVASPEPPEDAFDLDVWAPGTEILLARWDGGVEAPRVEPLLADLHASPADTRDPAFDPSGERLLFASRAAPDRGHDLYLLHLASGAVERLTDDAGPLPGGGLATHRDPTFGPDGAVWFVSTRAGVVADGGDRLDAELYRLDLETRRVDRVTHTPHIEREPVFLVVGEENGGEVAFTALRDLVPGQARAHPFRMPPDLSTEYHQHFGITPPETLFRGLTELPDGRYVNIVSDLGAPWGAGGLGVVDRNFGPELGPGVAPGLPGYRDPLTRLAVPGRFTHAAALADGRLLVAGVEDDAERLSVRVLTLDEAVDGSGPTARASRALLARDDAHLFDPAPRFRRRPAPDHSAAAEAPAEPFGLLLHQGLPMVDALLAALPPSGVKRVRDDIAGVRLIEALPLTPAERASLPGEAGATTTSLTPFAPQRILAELPLAADGTFQARVPAGVPFRIQPLDASGLATGVMHNRWFYVAPGQSLRQGVQPELYDLRCGGCHGARDGDPHHALPPPDGITRASTTLSRFVAADPRRPIEPPTLGDATRLAVDFREDVQPLLDVRCADAGCHGEGTPAAGLDLSGTPTDHFTRGYESIVRGGLVDVEEARAGASRLYQRVVGGLHGGLDRAEVELIARWIELGSTFVGRVDVP